MTAANVNDSKRLEQVLREIAVKRPMPTDRRSKHLCADAGYRRAELLRIIEWHGYIPQVVDRRRDFMALNHLAAAIIAFRKVPLDVNMIYG